MRTALVFRTLLRALAALPLLAALATLAGPAAGASGTAFVIGGGLKSSHDVVWQRLVQLAGGPGVRFVVLGTASEDPTGSAEAAAEQLRRRGAQAVVLPVSPLLKQPPIAEAVVDPQLIAQVKAARGIFFTGGSQDRIVDNLFPEGRRTPLLQAIWDVYEAGGVVAGTSAGAAIMSATMFRDAPDVVGVLKGRFAEGREVGRGLGFVGPALFVDQHFLKRGRLGRMLPVMRAHGYTTGLGVEEDSAAAVRDGQVEVVGGRAVFVDLAEARADEGAGAFALRGIRLSLLEPGDTLDVARRSLVPSEPKRRGQLLDPAAAGYKPYYTDAPYYVDFLADGVVATAMGLLIDARYDEIRGLAFDPRPQAGDALAGLGFEFRLYKAPGALGWYSEDSGGEDYTVHRLALDVLPVRIAQPFASPWRAQP